MKAIVKKEDSKYILAGIGAIGGLYVMPYVKNATAGLGSMGQAISELVIAGLSFVGGAYVENDYISAGLYGLGVTYAVEGLLNLFIPSSPAIATSDLAGSNWF